MRRLLVPLLAACTDDPISLGKEGRDSAIETAPAPLATWTRDEIPTPASVSFTELMVHPLDGESEWIELHNPMALDMDLSGWSLAGAVDYAFAKGTVIPAGGYLAVTVGDSGADALDDEGARLDLYNNFGRRIDTVKYATDDPWPVGPDGSGATLAKKSPNLWSDHAENWTVSAQIGGTPGAENGLDASTVSTVELIALESTWRYDDGGSYPAADWAEADYDDSAWDAGEAVFYAGGATGTATAIVRVTADNYYGLYLGSSDGSTLRLAAEDPDGDWTTVEEVEIEVEPDDQLYVAAWEADWDYGGPQMTIAEVELTSGESAGEIVGTSLATFEYLLGPGNGFPGIPPTDPPPDASELAALVAAGGWAAPAVEADRYADPWGWATGPSFDDDTQYIWADTFSDTSVTNTQNTYALFRSVEPLRGGGGSTELSGVPTTTLFRTDFTLDADPGTASLYLSCTLDDGAVFYLNGVEVLRENLPGGAINADTFATAAVDETEIQAEIDTTALLEGRNVLAVEVHDAGDGDLRFGCSLSARVSSVASTPAIQLNEVTDSWVELRASRTVEADGLLLAWPEGEVELSPGELAAGELALVEDLALIPGEPLFLYSADRATLLDAVRVVDRPRARDDAGEWRYPTEPTPGEANAIEVQESIVVSEIMYHHPTTEDPASEQEWIELFNRGDETVDLSGWQFVDALSYSFPEGTSLAAGAYLVVTDLDGRLDNTSARILLLDAAGNPADEVEYRDDGRWPRAADGGGASLELRDVWADNNAPEAWAASDESARTAWESVRYEGVADPSVVGPDGTWNELVLGLLDAGEVLIDDLSVVRDPGGAAVELVQNGGFDADSDHWRLLGNHRHSPVVPDPDDPGNAVLRLVATGATGHMHNHAETTLLEPIRETTYAVSFRARWLSGSNQLNSRLYFNRMPVTTLLTRSEDIGTPGEPNSVAEDIGPTFGELAQDIAVPAAGEPVTLSIDARDPDGVAEVILWTSVDEGAWTATAMAESDGTWTATIDGQAAGSIVQVYTEATDGAGNISWFPAAGPDSRALLTFDGGEAEDNGLHNLRILVTGGDSDWLHDDVNLMSDDLVGATVIWDESEVYYDVGVRLKGSERGRPEDARIGYALHFSGAQPFRGSHRSVLIDRSEGVGYGQREVLMNLVMTAAGSVFGEYNDVIQAITPLPQHIGPAELQLDRTSDLVLASQFDDGAEGPLYDYELIYYPYTTDDGTAEGLKHHLPDAVVGTPITDLGGDKEDWRWNFTLSNNLRDDDYSGIMALGEAFAYAGFPANAASVIDVDEWLRAFAFATLSGAVDNYGADNSQHNARFYARPDDGLMLYFPHDLDFIGSSQMAVIGNSDLARLLTDAGYERLYYGHLQDIIGRAYNTGYLGPWCDQLAALMPAQDFAGHCQFIDDRADWVMEGSSDAVLARFPRVTFSVSTGDFSTTEAEVDIEGQGWIDVRAIVVGGVPMEPEWTSSRTWRVTVPVEMGVNALVVVGTDLHGDEIGRGEVVVTRE